MRSITCGIPVGPDEERGVKYAINCIDVSLKRAASSVSTTWYLALDPLVDNDHTKNRFTSLFGDCVKFFSLNSGNSIRRQTNKCGDAHGSLLDSLVKFADSEYFCIHDSDIVFIRKNWNKYLLELFEKDEDLIAVGPESPLIDGWRNVPTSMLLAFRTNEFKKLGIVFNKTYASLSKFKNAGVANSDGTVTINENNKRYWNRKIGEKVYLETGYELVPALVDSGKQWHTLKTTVGDNNSQWYYDLDGKIFATHMTGSFVRPWGCEIRKSWSRKIQLEIDKDAT